MLLLIVLSTAGGQEGLSMVTNDVVSYKMDIICAIIGAIIGGLLGFAYTYIVGAIQEKKKSRQQQQTVIACLKGELYGIKKLIEGVEKVQFISYEYSLWKACVNSGYLLSLWDSDDFSKLVNAYKAVEHAAETESEYCDVYTRSLYYGSIDKKMVDWVEERRLKSRKDCLEKIKEAITEESSGIE